MKENVKVYVVTSVAFVEDHITSEIVGIYDTYKQAKKALSKEAQAVEDAYAIDGELENDCWTYDAEDWSFSQIIEIKEVSLGGQD